MISFRKLYTPIQDNGFIVAIVAFGKKPYMRKEIASPDEDMKEIVVVQYRKRLYIDLWLCILKFEWLTKEKKT